MFNKKREDELSRDRKRRRLSSMNPSRKPSTPSFPSSPLVTEPRETKLAELTREHPRVPTPDSSIVVKRESSDLSSTSEDEKPSLSKTKPRSQPKAPAISPWLASRSPHRNSLPIHSEDEEDKIKSRKPTPPLWNENGFLGSSSSSSSSESSDSDGWQPGFLQRKKTKLKKKKNTTGGRKLKPRKMAAKEQVDSDSEQSEKDGVSRKASDDRAKSDEFNDTEVTAPKPPEKQLLGGSDLDSDGSESGVRGERSSDHTKSDEVSEPVEKRPGLLQGSDLDSDDSEEEEEKRSPIEQKDLPSDDSDSENEWKSKVPVSDHGDEKKQPTSDNEQSHSSVKGVKVVSRRSHARLESSSDSEEEEEERLEVGRRLGKSPAALEPSERKTSTLSPKKPSQEGHQLTKPNSSSKKRPLEEKTQYTSLDDKSSSRSSPALQEKSAQKLPKKSKDGLKPNPEGHKSHHTNPDPHKPAKPVEKRPHNLTHKEEPRKRVLEKSSDSHDSSPAKKLRLVDIDFTCGRMGFQKPPLKSSQLRKPKPHSPMKYHSPGVNGSRVKPFSQQNRAHPQPSGDAMRVVSSHASNVLKASPLFGRNGKVASHSTLSATPTSLNHSTKIGHTHKSPAPTNSAHSLNSTPGSGRSPDIFAQKDAILAAKFPQKRKHLTEQSSLKHSRTDFSRKPALPPHL